MNTAAFLIAAVMALFAGLMVSAQQWGGAVFFALWTLLYIGDGIAAAIKEAGK